MVVGRGLVRASLPAGVLNVTMVVVIIVIIIAIPPLLIWSLMNGRRRTGQRGATARDVAAAA